ncbi:hypothetical protein [Tatumella punctata]|uniref:Uncharacterized protein n=1 Tax=Tatumella punctata TaxID=399969 RepID=A0ABW1VSV8_9GAMM
MSNIPVWAAVAASLSAIGALLNALTAIVNRYDAKIKAVKDLLAVRANFINSHVKDGVINTNKKIVMDPICKQILQVEDDIKIAQKIWIIRFVQFIFRSSVENELRYYFFTLLHSSLQDFFRDSDSDTSTLSYLTKVKEIYTIL